MNNEKVKKIIDNLTQDTINKKIKWNRIKTSLDIYSRENMLLRAYIEQYEQFPYGKNKEKKIDLIYSFVSDVKDGKVYLFRTEENENEILYIAIQSNNQSNVININNKDEFQNEINQLIFIISEQLNEVKNYLDKLLET